MKLDTWVVHGTFRHLNLKSFIENFFEKETEV